MMFTVVNPLLPTGSLVAWHAAILVTTVAVVVLPLIALIVLWRRRQAIEMTHLLLWALIILAAPVVGSVIWLTVGRRRDRTAVGATRT